MLKNWIDTYYLTRKTSRRGKYSVEYEIHFERNLVRLLSDLANHTFKPKTYAFITCRPKPREIFACDMGLRIIDTYIYSKIGHLINAALTDRTFNNRLGYGTTRAISSLRADIQEVSKNFTQDAWIIKLDIQGFFPNASHKIAYEKMKNILDTGYFEKDKSFIQYLLQISAFTSATANCERLGDKSLWRSYPAYKSLFTKPAGIGGIIGRHWWQVAMNLYLNDLDHRAVDIWGLHWNRFVDDMAIVTDNKQYVLQLIPKIRSDLASLGLQLHPKKFYCQHYTKGVEFIGATIKGPRLYANNKTIHNARRAILSWNKKVSIKNIESFLASINSYLGIFKNRREYKTIQKLIGLVDTRWEYYCYFSKEKMCFQAKDGFKHYQLLEKKYNIKLKKDGNKRFNRTTRSRKASLCQKNA